ncbi:MAG: hypothetical protein ABI352_04040 [Candidatus Dormibacter sp.]
MTHDYKRHGTTDLFAALNITSGEVLTHCRTSHAAADEELTDKRLRRGVFTSVVDLIVAIEKWAVFWNQDPRPFVWHTPAAEIIEKVQRGRLALRQIKSPTDH